MRKILDTTLLIATRNRHKWEEISAILRVPGVRFLQVSDLPGLPEVVEDGATFAENAIRKAAALARASGCWTLADDSGLEVDALGGAPGVLSARYAGEPSNDAANNRKLLHALDGVTNRAARFRCVIALASPDGWSATVEGACEGHLLSAPRGTSGFGYDPLFVPEGYDLTFAELDPAIKNRLSHRAVALHKAADAWRDLLKG